MSMGKREESEEEKKCSSVCSFLFFFLVGGVILNSAWGLYAGLTLCRSLTGIGCMEDECLNLCTISLVQLIFKLLCILCYLASTQKY